MHAQIWNADLFGRAGVLFCNEPNCLSMADFCAKYA
jgi:hypothetical protein